MAAPTNHDYQELASRLTAAADGIVNHAASGLDRDLREAARVLGTVGNPVGMLTISLLVSELAKIANTTSDPVTKERLTRLLGGA